MNSKIEDFVKDIPFIKGKPYWSNGEPRGAVKEFFIHLVDEGCFTVQEIQEQMRARYPEIKEGTIRGYPRHATNINGIEKDKNRLPFKAIIDEMGIIKFDKNFPAGSW